MASAVRVPVRFAVLGPVRLWREDVEVDVGAPQQRALLALLLAAGGQPVSVADLVDAMWAADPPASAVNVVHRYVGALRRLIEPGLPSRDPGQWLLASAGGYRLAVEAGSLDVLRFRELTERANAESSPELYAEGLALWQGPAAIGLTSTVRNHPIFTALDRERAAAACAAADLALATGTAHLLLPGVRHAAELAPLDESLQAKLILLLGSAGLQADALAHYRLIADRLAEELGLDPGRELTAARDTVLRGSSARVTPDVEAPDRPAQLPPDLPTFAGRKPELDRAMAILDGRQTAGTVVITALGGMAGVGKTTLAVHWAHRVADRYPDGQLYVNLRGFDAAEEVVSPAEALRGMLGALGVPYKGMPSEVDVLAALFRTQLAGRRILLVLDNARNAEQIRPLLPGAAGCLVIVTSRDRLSGLVAVGAAALNLDVFHPAESRELLIRRIGPGRVSAEPEAVDDIVAMCAHLPLTLSIVAARAAVHPSFSLRAIAAELRHAYGSLDAFAGRDTAVNVRAVFSWSYRALTAEAARLFRLLGVHPGPDLGIGAAASIAGVEPRRVRLLLNELAQANLLNENRPGRFGSHDLLRAYAEELADDPDEAGAARHRMFDHYLHSALPAHTLISPGRGPIELTPAVAGAFPEDIADEPGAIAWFTAEQQVSITAVQLAARHGFDRHAWQLQWLIYPFMVGQVAAEQALTVLFTSVEALRRLGDLPNQARVEMAIADLYVRTDQYALADELFRRVLRQCQELGDLAGQSSVYHGLAGLSDRQGDHHRTLYYIRQELDISRRRGNRLGELVALAGVAWVHAQLDEHRDALAAAHEGLALVKDGSHHNAAGSLWHTVGYVHARLDEHDEAVHAFHRAIDLAARVGDRYLGGTIHADLGDVLDSSGDAAGARASWERAAELLDGYDRRRAEELRKKLDDRP